MARRAIRDSQEAPVCKKSKQLRPLKVDPPAAAQSAPAPADEEGVQADSESSSSEHVTARTVRNRRRRLGRKQAAEKQTLALEAILQAPRKNKRMDVIAAYARQLRAKQLLPASQPAAASEWGDFLKLADTPSGSEAAEPVAATAAAPAAATAHPACSSALCVPAICDCANIASLSLNSDAAELATMKPRSIDTACS